MIYVGAYVPIRKAGPNNMTVLNRLMAPQNVWYMYTHVLTTVDPSQQDNAKLLQERAVAYINADSAIEGERICIQPNILNKL